MTLSSRFCRCGGASRVIDVCDSGETARRRRECIVCGHRWTTRERLDDDEMTHDSPSTPISGVETPEP
jgi:transcriptional regulator NrdR family protein